MLLKRIGKNLLVSYPVAYSGDMHDTSECTQKKYICIDITYYYLQYSERQFPVSFAMRIWYENGSVTAYIVFGGLIGTALVFASSMQMQWRARVKTVALSEQFSVLYLHHWKKYVIMSAANAETRQSL